MTWHAGELRPCIPFFVFVFFQFCLRQHNEKGFQNEMKNTFKSRREQHQLLLAPAMENVIALTCAIRRQSQCEHLSGPCLFRCQCFIKSAAAEKAGKGMAIVCEQVEGGKQRGIWLSHYPQLLNEPSICLVHLVLMQIVALAFGIDALLPQEPPAVPLQLLCILLILLHLQQMTKSS